MIHEKVHRPVTTLHFPKLSIRPEHSIGLCTLNGVQLHFPLARVDSSTIGTCTDTTRTMVYCQGSLWLQSVNEKVPSYFARRVSESYQLRESASLANQYYGVEVVRNFSVRIGHLETKPVCGALILPVKDLRNGCNTVLRLVSNKYKPI
jgi:hypothetical protein